MGCLVFGYLAGYVTQVDYNGEGVIMVLLLYLLRNVRFKKIGQLASMLFVHVGLFGNQAYQWFNLSVEAYNEQASNWLTTGGWMFYLPCFGHGWSWAPAAQGFAVLSLIPIWLYNGKQGPHNRWLQYLCYAFYPAHLLILGLLAKLV